MRIELRADSVVLDGYVLVTQRESRVLPSPRGKFVEEIMPRTFERALMKTDSIELLFNHNKARRLGSIKDGNLELREDNVGLRAIATVYDDEVITKAKNGELRGWSFGFASIRDRWSVREDGMQKRTIEDLELFEVSILDKTPAYIAQSIEARNSSDESVLSETRIADFEAKVDDYSDRFKDKTDEEEETTKSQKQEEKREDITLEPLYFEHLENELKLLQL